MSLVAPFVLIPGFGLLITILLASLLTIFVSFIWRVTALSVLHLLFIGLGVGLIVYYVLPNLFSSTRVFRKYAIVLGIISIILVILGVPNLVFSMIGNPINYSVVPLIP